MHHGQKGGGRPSNVEDLIEETNMLRRKAPARSCLAFHPSRKDIVAFGSDDGSVEIFRLPHYVRLATLKTFQKLIQSLVWHPTHFADSADGADSSRYADHLAVASNEKDVHVFDLSEILAKNEGQDATTVLSSDDTETKVHNNNNIRNRQFC